PYTLYTSNTSLVMLSRISPTTALSILFCNDPATTDIYTLSLHDALPISSAAHPGAPALGELCHERVEAGGHSRLGEDGGANRAADRKSTRLNSSHVKISYAVFCLKKKRKTPYPHVRSGSQRGRSATLER